VAENENTPFVTLEKMIDDKDVYVRNAVWENKQAKYETKGKINENKK
jgi:3-methyladenine DNA glycosylase AlkC